MFGCDGYRGDLDGNVAHAPGALEFGGVADCAAGVVFVEDVGRLGVEAAGDRYGEGVGEDDGGSRRGRGRRDAEGGSFGDRDGRREEDAIRGGAVGEKRASGGMSMRCYDH